MPGGEVEVWRSQKYPQKLPLVSRPVLAQLAPRRVGRLKSQAVQRQFRVFTPLQVAAARTTPGITEGGNVEVGCVRQSWPADYL
jgi:hypothetical protein